MDYDFHKFTNVKGRFDDRISVTRSFSFGYPTKFWEDNNIGNYKYVTLFFDGKKKAVAFYFHNSEDEKSKFTLIDHDNYGGAVAARSFFLANNLDPKEYKGKYSWRKMNLENVGKVFVIELNQKED